MASNMMRGTIPAIAQAYQNDPRSKLAQSVLANGISSAPVAQGGWAVTDGLARAAQAVVGAMMAKKLGKEGLEREQKYTDTLRDAVAASQAPEPVQALAPPPPPQPASTAGLVQPGAADLSGAAAALGGQAPQMGGASPQTAAMALTPAMLAGRPETPLQQVDPDQAAYAPQGAQGSPGGTFTPPAASFASQARPPATQRPNLDVSAMYRNGILPIEGGTDPQTGAFRTSPKGAYGPAQLMPGTAPEAMELAGYSRNDQRWKTDANINIQAGQAYYEKKLKEFNGDAFKAAAAYNAGAGRVRRAIRKAAKVGGDWSQHLPPETQEYIVKFAARLGGDGADGAVEGTVSAGQPPQYEEVPSAPSTPTEAPQLPDAPDPVRSRRLAVANALLSSGNPDMVAMAQEYLDKGMSEQFQSDSTANEQQYNRGNLQYGYQMGDYNAARSDARTNAYGERRDAQQRNFEREQTANTQGFQSRENALQRDFQSREASIDRDWKTREAQLDRDVQTQEIMAKVQQIRDKNPYLDTVGGAKLITDMENSIGEYDKSIGQFTEALRYLGGSDDKSHTVTTGGVRGLVNAQWGSGAFSSDVGALKSLMNKTTLSELGGKLGTAISDGDRNFITQSNINFGTSNKANIQIARAAVAGLQRAKDYEYQKIQYKASGENPTVFNQRWRAFVNSNPIVQYDAKGNRVISERPITFDQWIASRPRFDANGNRVK